MATTQRPKADTTIGVRVTSEEKRQLADEAAAEGTTLSTLLYRRALNKPGFVRRQGRQPRFDPSADEPIEGIGMTG